MNTIVSSKGQIVIPQDIRERLKIRKGQRVKIEEVDGAIVVFPLPKDSIRALKGSAKIGGESTKIVRSLRKEWDE
ncbi:MAG: AbrB/MazE/SpoVT family DNA-binding domain-containing protein [Candidatus Aenigmarchaeota archaeon]|nr:AbrB/MazE/SpoVT family DNA-binding domain-containing protein [Candidatus Aenigmarchaeota archaeon]